MNSVLHTLNDGSIVQIMKASDLVKIGVWKGNRIIDSDHVKAIMTTVDKHVSSLDFGYRLVNYKIMDGGGKSITITELVDGQHRHAVLCEYFKTNLFSEDFPVVVTIKHVESEDDIVEYFNMLNNVKPIIWSDPTLIINKYIGALEKAFNKSKSLMIRLGATHRPYLSADKLRDEFNKYKGLSGNKSDVSAFVERVNNWNNERVRTADLTVALGGKHSEFVGKAANVGFMLAVDPKLPWIRECLK
jgi:hypothetical protein